MGLRELVLPETHLKKLVEESREERLKFGGICECSPPPVEETVYVETDRN